MNAPLVSPLDQFLALARQLGADRREDEDHQLYAHLKRDLVRDFPALSPGEYARAVDAISRATGIDRK